MVLDWFECQTEGHSGSNVPYAYCMGSGIRRATADDAATVAAFFAAVYEMEHGRGSAGALEMLQRTIAVLFPEEHAPVVYLYETDAIHGVGAVRDAGDGIRELVTVQVFDTVQGRGVAQTLLHHLVEQSRSDGCRTIFTLVPPADVRARGFLRREGFVSDGDDRTAGDAEPLRYVLSLKVDGLAGR